MPSRRRCRAAVPRQLRTFGNPADGEGTQPLDVRVTALPVPPAVLVVNLTNKRESRASSIWDRPLLFHRPNARLGLAMSETGLLSGTPGKAGEFTFSVTATNSSGSTVAGPFTIKISETPPVQRQVTTQSLPGGVVGQPYRGSLAAIGGATPYRWSVVTGTLPPGLTLDKSTGKLSGTPTAPGKSTVTFRVVDSTTPTAQTATVKVSITIVRPTISLSPARLPVAQVGSAYKVVLTAAGGSGPYAFTLDRGSPPNGISLSSSGTLTGTPKKTGVYWFRIQAKDAFGNTGQRWFWMTVRR